MSDEEMMVWLVAQGRREGDCLVWPHTIDKDGYGQVRYRKRLWRVPRLVWFLRHPSTDPNLTIDHVHARGCRHRACFLYEHLEAVTRPVNSQRGQQQRKRDGNKEAYVLGCRRIQYVKQRRVTCLEARLVGLEVPILCLRCRHVLQLQGQQKETS